ncbi:MAG: hypothetical protein WA191_05105 [Telluria sp.]
MRSSNALRAQPGLRLPVKGSRAECVLERLYAAPCTLAEAGRRHSDFGISHTKLETIFEGLIAIGCVDLTDGTYSISTRVRRHFDDLSMPGPAPAAGMIAGPAYRPEPKPLNVARLGVRMSEMREGAQDYLSIPSRIGDTRIAHGTGK